MASTLQHRKSLDSEEKRPSRDEEKDEATITVSSADSANEDEALKLVGRERTTKFSEEYNRKLRNKLVRRLTSNRSQGPIVELPVRVVGSHDLTAMCGCVLYSVLVGCITSDLGARVDLRCRDKTSLNYARYP